MINNTPILSVKNLSIGYEQALYSDLTFELFKGEMIGIIGANGRGKSTLIKTLMGTLPTLQGSIAIESKSLNQWLPHQRAQRISVVLTERVPDTYLTVEEVIALGRYPYTNWSGKFNQEDQDIVSHILNFTQLNSLANQKFVELSDGQKQNVMIARALAQDTSLVLLDEPTAHLDIPNKIKLFRRLQAWCNETQKCFVYATHDLDAAFQISHRLIVLTPKELVIDTPQNLIDAGVMDQIFEDDDVFFDRKTQRFLTK